MSWRTYPGSKGQGALSESVLPEQSYGQNCVSSLCTENCFNCVCVYICMYIYIWIYTD